MHAVIKHTHIQGKCLHECHMSCMKCHHAHIPSHSPTISHKHMPSVKTTTGITNDLCIEPSPAHHYPMQVPMGNQSRVNPDSYHTTRSLCDKHDRVYFFGNRTSRLTPRVSYTHTELFGLTAGLSHPYRTFWILPLVSYTQIPSFSPAPPKTYNLSF